MPSSRRIVLFTSTAIWSLFSIVSGQEAATLPPAPIPAPAPHCDPYSMQTLPTLNLQQRACYWRDQLVTGPAISGAAFWGALGEWRHKPREWPQGLQGFGMQVGTRYTQGMVKSTATFIAGTILREDPRPLPPTDLSCPDRATRVLPRLGQALTRVVWTRTPDCKGRPAFSRIAGSFASGFVALAWQPASSNTINTALAGTGTALGGYFGNSVFTEFQGDLFRFVGKIFTSGKPRPAPGAGK